MRITSHLRRFRTDRGLTQVEIAIMTRVGLSTVCKLEKNPEQVKRRTRIRLAKALGLNHGDLFQAEPVDVDVEKEQR